MGKVRFFPLLMERWDGRRIGDDDKDGVFWCLEDKDERFFERILKESIWRDVETVGKRWVLF